MALPYQAPGDPADIKGTGLPIEQPDAFRFIRGQGWTTVKSWHALKKDAAFGKAKELELAGYTNIDVRKTNGAWVVEGQIEGVEGLPPEEENEIWELDSLSESVDIINHPMFQGLTDNELRVILDAVQNPVPGTAPTVDGAALAGDAKTLYELLIRKVESYNYEVPVLRHTLTPAPSSVNIDGRLEIWTAAQINVTTPVIASMVLQYYNTNPFGAAPKHTWGWLNTILRVTEDVYGRSQLIEEWLLGNWQSDIYPNY